MTKKKSIAWWIENDPECVASVSRANGVSSIDLHRMMTGSASGDLEQGFLVNLEDWRKQNPIHDPWKELSDAVNQLGSTLRHLCDVARKQGAEC